MKDKIQSIFGLNEPLYITQTTHGHRAKPYQLDFSFHRALDLIHGRGSMRDATIKAALRGTVRKAEVIENGNIPEVNKYYPYAQSYVDVAIDGLPSYLTMQYAHVYPTIKVGQRVDVDTIIGNCSWHHVHLSLCDIEGRGREPELLDYLARSIPMRTYEPVILASRYWFNADGTFNWSSFQDQYIILSTEEEEEGGIMQNHYYTVKGSPSRGLWRSEVIQEIINSGLWSGTWQQRQPEFDRMNPTTPDGGWKPGSQVIYKQTQIEQPKPPVDISNPGTIDIDVNTVKSGNFKLGVEIQNWKLKSLSLK